MSIYLDVEKMVDRIDRHDLSRSTLQAQRSRFKSAGRLEEAEAIKKALEMTSNSASAVLRQSKRLAANFDGMDAEKALALKATVAAYASQSTDLQASVVLAFQSLFHAKGVPMEYEEVSAYLSLYAMDHFEKITGELPVIVH
ncbi:MULTISPECIES: hypothetical protein [Enterobacteriaceae]|uniref:Uncharacterized protein n=1 Tax=Enterobacter chuandaensis TaxID=2497875 RepID=A0AA96M1R6_9ENTR|nr:MULTISPECIES: hypothetical protein [Enterobacteriaceae]ELY2512052.1 hypothetical protein [Cronobacter malonaticus]EMA4737211.1 hypothetical protein [Enterobacter asburiae]ELC6459230.1 hypothetical protein [Enterobacter hormaechei]ELC6477713.1 hypothetical protein [Enterobacter hormaechei]KZQ30030.1 hypothetical protein A3N44_08810 [Enterobacter hormaechei subsp. steigerwaltii]